MKKLQAKYGWTGAGEQTEDSVDDLVEKAKRQMMMDLHNAIIATSSEESHVKPRASKLQTMEQGDIDVAKVATAGGKYQKVSWETNVQMQKRKSV